MTARPRPVAQVPRAPRVGRLAGAAMLLSASFVLSRILGLLRNVAIAAIFGNSPPVDAYFAAFRIPDAMFMLVSGGALASAFVPILAALLERGEEDEAWEVASTVFNSVVLALAALAVVAFVFAPLIMDLLVPGYGPAKRSLTIDLTRIMLLQPIFLGMGAVLTAILQTNNRFTLTAIAPLVYNLAVILGAVFFGHAYGVTALAWAVVAGALAQVVIQLPGIWREAFSWYRFKVNWESASAREMLRLLSPRVVGLAAFQAMLFITLFLASGLPTGMVAAINYAWPLIMFPIGALGTAAATAIFPTLSRMSALEDLNAVRRTVNRSLRLIIFLALPSAVGLMVVREPIVNLLYNHNPGQWTSISTQQTSFALLFYAMAIAPLAVIEVLPRVFYAMKDTVTPVRIAVAAVTLDAILSIVLVHVLQSTSGQGGLALATAIASTVQAIWLALALNGALESIGLRALLLTLRDAALASFVMALVLYIVLDPLMAVLVQRGWGALITVFIEVGLGVGTFVLASYVIGAPELWEVRGFVTRMR